MSETPSKMTFYATMKDGMCLCLLPWWKTMARSWARPCLLFPKDLRPVTVGGSTTWLIGSLDILCHMLVCFDVCRQSVLSDDWKRIMECRMLWTEVGGYGREHAEVDRGKLNKRHPAAASLVRPWKTRTLGWTHVSSTRIYCIWYKLFLQLWHATCSVPHLVGPVPWHGEKEITGRSAGSRKHNT